MKLRLSVGVRALLAHPVDEFSFDQFQPLGVQQARSLERFAFAASPSLTRGLQWKWQSGRIGDNGRHRNLILSKAEEVARLNRDAEEFQIQKKLIPVMLEMFRIHQEGFQKRRAFGGEKSGQAASEFGILDQRKSTRGR